MVLPDREQERTVSSSSHHCAFGRCGGVAVGWDNLGKSEPVDPKRAEGWPSIHLPLTPCPAVIRKILVHV